MDEKTIRDAGEHHDLGGFPLEPRSLQGLLQKDSGQCTTVVGDIRAIKRVANSNAPSRCATRTSAAQTEGSL